MTMYLTQGLRKAARQSPDLIATICTTRQRTFKQLYERVSRMAGALASLGVKSGDRVAILAFNSDHYFEMMLATLWAGGVITPLNTRWSPSELEYALTNAEAGTLFVDGHFLALGRQLEAGIATLTTVICDADNAPETSEKFSTVYSYQQLIEAHAPIPDRERRGEDIAMLMYTGGTTGFPKGVLHSHTSLMSGAVGQCAIGCGTGGGRYLHIAPMFHMGDMQLTLTHMLAGGSHVMLPKFVPEDIFATIRDHKVTSVLLVPTMLRILIDHPTIGDYDFSSLKRIFYGASPITQNTLAAALEQLRGCEFIQGYGMTETCLVSMLPAKFHNGSSGSADKLKSAGQATALAEIKILDPESEELPRGDIGEVVVKGPSLMQGYWRDPEGTEQALRNGWIHTGDVGYMDEDGFIFIVDRLKDMIVTGGENVYSTEVENALATHPAISQCAVVGIPHKVWGEQVHAAVVLQEGASVDGAQLIQFCKGRIADYKCPRSVEILTSLPLSPAGKILKNQLRDAAQSID